VYKSLRPCDDRLDFIDLYGTQHSHNGTLTNVCFDLCVTLPPRLGDSSTYLGFVNPIYNTYLP
jgi:hypothetical protein